MAPVKGRTPIRPILTVARLRTETRIPKGPKLFHQDPKHLGGPGKPPPHFVVGQTSASEWNFYWALAKVYGNPPDPRQPPFYGGFPDWGYQVSAAGPYRRSPGSAVVDFVVYTARETIGIRLQTIRFHYVTDAEKQAFDALQRFTLEAHMRVVDVQEEDVLGDETGAKYIVTAKRAIGLVFPLDPIVAGVDPRRKFA